MISRQRFEFTSFRGLLVILIRFNMSSCKILLMNIPYLPFRQIIDEVVDSLGLRKVLPFRFLHRK